MSNRRIMQVSALAMAGFCLWAVMEWRVEASVQAPIHIRVIDYPRPVSAAVLQIEKHFGGVVTYEDTRYVHADDIVDITEQTRRDYTRSTRIFGRRNGSIDLTYTPRPGPIDTQVGEVLQAVVARSNAAGNAGEFRIDQVPGAYHVVPVAIKGKSGRMESYTSPLEARITVPSQEENGLEMMLRLASVITTFSGYTVNPGTMPMNRLERARVTAAAQNEIDQPRSRLSTIGARFSATGPGFESPYRYHPSPAELTLSELRMASHPSPNGGIPFTKVAPTSCGGAADAFRSGHA